MTGFVTTPVQDALRRRNVHCVSHDVNRPSVLCKSLVAQRARRSQILCSVAPDRLNGEQVLPMPLLCCIDMDGTILNSQSKIHPRNVDTVIRLLESTDVRFVPATGKSRAGAVKSMADLGKYLEVAHPQGVPGVYLQGLCVYGADGSLCYERTLAPDISNMTVALGKALGVTLIAYGVDGNTILCETEDDETAKLEVYSEPKPEPVGSWNSIIGRESIHKFIFMAPEDQILAIRPRIEAELGKVAAITRATPGMLEVLPLGASKGDGVSRLLQSLSISPERVLAVGDGENDVEMFRLCGIPVAMANAVPAAMAAAKYRTASNDDGGLADAVERFVFQSAIGSISQIETAKLV